MAFSGALTLTDLNDFITPSQACIKPVEVKEAPSLEDGSHALTQIKVDGEGGYYEVNKTGNEPSRKLEKAQISLNDCLACSGCITSAESVLITMQSHEEVLEFSKSNPPISSPEHRIGVLSIAPQALASLAATLSTSSRSSPSLEDVLERIRAFAKQELGFDHVFDTTFARHIALEEHTKEFEERRAKPSNESLPMLASACPGWVCYAEKAHAEMLPFISTTKSPQQIMGSLVKEWMAKSWNKTPDQVYHVTVMPCYDKKLEASRQDFYNEQYRTRDVDCVITTGELELLLRERQWDLNRPVEKSNRGTLDIPDLLSPPGSSSGSWLQTIVDHVQRREKETHGRETLVRTKMIRTSDYEDVIVEAVSEDGQVETLFRGAKCYGFRNLQNIVRKVAKERAVGKSRVGLKARRAKNGVATNEDRPYDYVEVMACPGGCVNGGGQARRPLEMRDEEGHIRDWKESGVGDSGGMGSRWGDREWVKAVEVTYWGNSGRIVDALRLNEIVARIGTDLGEHVVGKGMFRTQYREVKSDIIGLNVNW